jgi:hypothetical protein
MNAALNFLLKNPLAAFLTVVIVCLTIWVGVVKWDLHQANQAHAEVTTERDSVAVAAAADRARTAGWEVSFAKATANLHKMLRQRDTAMATLVQDLRASNARLSYVTEVNVKLRGQAESFGRPVDAPEGQTPSQWAGELDDGLLRASWGFWAVDGRLLLDPYWLDIAGEYVGAESGDGQHVVFGRAFDPRVTLSFGEYHFQPPPIEVRNRCSWTRQGIAGGIGFLGGLWTGARAVR